jgi:superfamily I DNA/RNA helicase
LTEYLSRRTPEFSAHFLYAEWNSVILAGGLRSLADYLTTARPGRGSRRLSAAQRKQVWSLISGFEAELRGAGLRTFRQIATDAAGYAAYRREPIYRHVIVDEAQDLHASHWRLLRALVPAGPDDMFLVGDPFQRIYDNRAVLGHCGVKIQGRAKRLTINYRTTRQILEASLSLVNGSTRDDLDGGTEGLHSYRSLMRGRPPVTHGSPDAEAELAQLVATIRAWHDGGIDYDDIAVGARSRVLVQQACAALTAAELPAFVLTGRRDDDGKSGVHVTTLHRLKGTEFRCVALTGLNADQVPSPRDLADVADDPAATAAVLAQERSLLFVAGTRAREDLAIGWHGTCSPLLAPIVPSTST